MCECGGLSCRLVLYAHVMFLFTLSLRGDECITKSWTYYIHPGRDDLELEGNLEC